MTVNSQRLLLAAAGATAADGALYVDDVFSTYVYEGTGTTQPIDNGLDLSGQGGLVWIKRRDAIGFHWLHDTERGTLKYVSSHNTNAEGSQTNSLTAFNSDGFTLGGETNWNGDGNDFVSWTFRKAPGFFDVVTYTGDGTNPRSIAHSLGSKPGFFIVKRLDAAGSFWCYHHSRTNSKVLELNTTAAEDTFSYWPSEPTSTHFTVSSSASLNGSGNTYVCYLFAHDDQSFGEDEDEAIIKCGSYTGTGSSGNAISLGFEPQWVMIKRTSSADGWMMFDIMRGMPVDGTDPHLRADLSAAESSAADYLDPTPTGFTIKATGGSVNSSGDTYVYMAIRRPHKPPEAGTDVFAIDTLGGTSPSPPGWTSGFPVDWEFIHKDNATSQWESITRLTMKLLYLNLTNVESALSSSNDTFDHMTGWSDSTATNANNFSWMFRRAPGFFDVVTYDGTGSAQNINHNLTVTPGLIIVRERNFGEPWRVYSSATGSGKSLRLDSNIAASTSSTFWNDTAPTSTVFTVGSNDGTGGPNGRQYVGYLFATLAGISKVGSYTGTGSNIGVDCGFTAGARFVLIKRTDSTGDWYVYDSTRGIVGGDDPYLLINSTAAEVTNTDYIDPLNSGFTVTSSAPAALNASGGTYIFLAIA